MRKAKHAKPVTPFTLPQIDLSKPRVYWTFIACLVLGSTALVLAFMWELTQ